MYVETKIDFNHDQFVTVSHAPFIASTCCVIFYISVTLIIPYFLIQLLGLHVVTCLLLPVLMPLLLCGIRETMKVNDLEHQKPYFWNFNLQNKLFVKLLFRHFISINVARVITVMPTTAHLSRNFRHFSFIFVHEKLIVPNNFRITVHCFVFLLGFVRWLSVCPYSWGAWKWGQMCFLV